MPSTFLFLVVDTVSVLFLGDVMQHKEQLRSALIPGGDTLVSSSYDYSSYFRHVRRYIDSADFTVANMEFCLGGAPYTGYPSFSAPEELAQEAAGAGIDLFLCANNHICDRGRRGLASSLAKYEETGIPVTGLYRDSTAESTDNPFIADVGGISIAFVNFTYGTNGVRVPPPYVVNMMDKDAVRTAVHRAEDRGADIVVALPHWGQEYTTRSDSTQHRWARFLLECGADAVIGSHPHVIQEVEFPVIYSLGNFISNMSLRNTGLGIMYRLDIAVTSYGQAFIAGGEAIPVWCSRAGGYEKGYTVLPVPEFLERRDEFANPADYDKMKDTYDRLKPLFENDRKEGETRDSID